MLHAEMVKTARPTVLTRLARNHECASSCMQSYIHSMSPEYHAHKHLAVFELWHAHIAHLAEKRRQENCSACVGRIVGLACAHSRAGNRYAKPLHSRQHA